MAYIRTTLAPMCHAASGDLSRCLTLSTGTARAAPSASKRDLVEQKDSNFRPCVPDRSTNE